MSLLEGYFYVQKKFDSEKITFTLLRSLPHVKYWWDGYCERHVRDETEIFNTKPTWEYFADAIKEEFYHIENYDDQYTQGTTFHKERDQMVPEYTNIFYTL